MDELEPNPVVQGVKLIMVSIIFLVHSLKTSGQIRNSLSLLFLFSCWFFKSSSALMRYHSPSLNFNCLSMTFSKVTPVIVSAYLTLTVHAFCEVEFKGPIS